MGADLEVKVLSSAGHGERSKPQSVGPRGQREGSGARSGGPTNRNRIEGVAAQGERAGDREALVTKARRRRSGGRAAKAEALTRGDLVLRLKGRRSVSRRREVSRGQSSRACPGEGPNEEKGETTSSPGLPRRRTERGEGRDDFVSGLAPAKDRTRRRARRLRLRACPGEGPNEEKGETTSSPGLPRRRTERGEGRDDFVSGLAPAKDRTRRRARRLRLSERPCHRSRSHSGAQPKPAVKPPVRPRVWKPRWRDGETGAQAWAA